MSTAEIFAIETLSDKAVALGAMLDHIIPKNKKTPLGAISNTRARARELSVIGSMRLSLDTAEGEGSDKLQLKLFVGIALFAAEATCTKGWWLRLYMRIGPQNFSVARSCFTILDKVDQKVRTKASVTTELSNFASWHRAALVV